MTVPAQAGLFGFAMQAAKVGEGGTFTPTESNLLDWLRVRSVRNAADLIQGDQLFPPEVGGPINPTGAYKDSAYFGGDFDIIPRMEETLGFLLWGTLGDASSATGKYVDGSTVANVNTHIFRQDTSSSYTQPWMAFRRSIPGAVPATDTKGITGFDCKIAQMTLQIPAAGKLAVNITVMGRDSFQEQPPVWSWANTLEDTQSTPDAGRGYFKIAGVEYPITGAQIVINNTLTTPQQEMVVGSFHPDDFIALQRSIQIQMVYKWKDPALYNEIYNGGSASQDWSSLPFITDTAGAVFAFEASFQAPANIPGTSTPYELRLRANRVVWQTQGPIELAGAQIVQQAYTCTVLEPAGGADYFTASLVNGQTSYA